MLGTKAAGYHGRLIFLANGAQRVTHISYVGRYVGLVQSRVKNMSLRTNGVNLVGTYLSTLGHSSPIIPPHRSVEDRVD